MGYEKVTDLNCDTVVKLGGTDEKTGKKNPTEIEGFYLGGRKVKTTTGESTIHVFQTDKGNKGIWGSADTNSKLSSAPLGAMTLVEFKGKMKIGGGKTKNLFDVSVDRDNVITVSAPPTSRVSASSNDEQEEDNYEVADDSSVDDEEEQEDSYEGEERKQTSALAAQEAAAVRAKKVQALLGKNRKSS